ncbi:tigger transposable element-derived protein 6, partial [Biomphalaria glabrata]
GRASTWSPEDLQKALEALRNKYGLNEVSRLYGIPKPTLKRHLDGENKFANGNVVQRGRMTVLPADLENELVSHINQLEGMLFGLTRNDIRCLAYQIAEKNGLSRRFNKTEGMAGKDWFRDFKKRHNLSLRQPEATSLARSTGFNKIAVTDFLTNLKASLQKIN